LTGGLPPIANGCTAESVYRACFEQVVSQNEKYYKRFPQDIEVVHELVKHLSAAEGGGVSSSYSKRNYIYFMDWLFVLLVYSKVVSSYKKSNLIHFF
jgi:hypothetical protein